MRRGLFALALIATPAAAQTSDTTCSQMGQFVNCHTTGQQSQGVDWAGWARLQQQQQAEQQQTWANLGNAIAQRRAAQQAARDREVRESYERAQAELAQQKADLAAEKAAHLREQVGTYLGLGNCNAAQSLALEAGDIALAAQAKAYCANRAP